MQSNVGMLIAIYNDSDDNREMFITHAVQYYSACRSVLMVLKYHWNIIFDSSS